MSAEEKRLDDLRRKQERDQLEAEEAASLAPAPKAAAKKTQFEVRLSFCRMEPGVAMCSFV